MLRTCIIFNPTARGEKAKRLVRELKGPQSDCALKPTLAAGDARRLGAEAVREGYDTIVAVGGDGTINEVLNGIADEPEGFARVRLAVVPVGTVNVFARELGIPLSFRGAWRVVRSGHETLIDVPQIQFETPHGRQRRAFAQMAGCGLDAQAVALLDWELKKKIGQFAYVFSALRALREKAPPVMVCADGRRVSAQLVLIGNGRFYGGSIPIFRQADLKDGLLDVCVFPKVNWFVLMRYACAFVAPKLLQQRAEQHFQAATLRIESSHPAPIQLDGEHVGSAPAEFVVQRAALRVLVPTVS